MTNLEFLQKKIGEMTPAQFKSQCISIPEVRLNLSRIASECFGRWRPWCDLEYWSCEYDCRDCFFKWLEKTHEE